MHNLLTVFNHHSSCSLSTIDTGAYSKLLLRIVKSAVTAKPRPFCNVQVRTQLTASESSVSSLMAELSKAEAQAKEVSRLQQAVEQAQRDKRAVAQEWQKEQASLERQLQAAGKNRDQLAEQVLSCV